MVVYKNSILKKKNIYIFMFIVIFLCIINLTAKADTFSTDMKTNRKSLMWSPRGLEIDAEGNIYISTMSNINIYNSYGEFIYAIQVDTSGSYEMMFQDDGNLNIAIARGEFTYVYSKDGILLDKDEKMGYETYVNYHKNNKVKFDNNGNKYVLSNPFGYTKVTRTMTNGTKSVVYRIPFIEWLVKLLFCLFVALFFITIPYLVLKHHGFIRKK